MKKEAKNEIKDALEIEKLQIEIQKLKKPTWRNSSFLIPIIIPFVAILITYYANKDYINLQLEVKSLKLEKESIELEKKKEALNNRITEQSKILTKYSNRSDSISKLLSASNIEYKTLMAKNENLSQINKNLKTGIQREQIKANQLSYKNLELNETSNHRLHFIAMEHQLKNLDYFTGIGKGVFSAYNRALKDGQWTWYHGWQKHKLEIDTAFIYNYEPYTFKDPLMTVEKQMLNTWKSTRTILSEIDSLVNMSANFDHSDYIKRLKEAEEKYIRLQIPWGSWIDYNTLQLMSPKTK